MQEFIDTYSPDYDQEKIINEEMEILVQDVLRTKTIHSPIVRIIISWVINDPLMILLIFASINLTIFIYLAFDLNQYITPDELFSKFFPALILMSTGNIIILFLFPNLVFGFLSPNRNIAVLNSIVNLVVSIILFAYSSEPAFCYIILGHLPLTLIFSLFFLFIGIKSSSKRFLKK